MDSGAKPTLADSSQKNGSETKKKRKRIKKSTIKQGTGEKKRKRVKKTIDQEIMVTMIQRFWRKWLAK
jgi:hypothetical protein